MIKKYKHKQLGHEITMSVEPMDRAAWWRKLGWYIPKVIRFDSGFYVERYIDGKIRHRGWYSQHKLNSWFNVN